MKLSRIYSGIAFIIIAIVFYIETKNFPLPLGKDVGSAFWPKLLIFLLITLSISLIITGITNKGEKKSKTKKKYSYQSIKPYIGMAVCITFVLLFKPIGYVLSVFIFFILLVLTMNNKINLKLFITTAIQAILLVLAIHLLFERLLSVNLPTGIFYF